MDVILESVNSQLDGVFNALPLALGRDDPFRVFAVLYVIVYLGGFFSYFIFATMSYVVVYKIFPERMLEEHDQEIAPGQIKQEILISLKGMPLMALLTVPIYMAEWAGYTRVYYSIDEYGWTYFGLSIVLFLLFTDSGVYWIHRSLHSDLLYQYVERRVLSSSWDGGPWECGICLVVFSVWHVVLVGVLNRSVAWYLHRYRASLHNLAGRASGLIKRACRPLHRVHHLFRTPSPFAAIAFHPIDGWLQSTPYHLFVLLFPLYNWLYLFLFVFVQLWTISIHDRVSAAPLDGVLNGSAHHACHHLDFNYNYGQYFTFWDRVCGTHRVWDGGMPVRNAKRLAAKAQKQAREAKKRD